MKTKLDQRLTIRLAWTEKGWISLAARRLGITPSQAVRRLVQQAIARDTDGASASMCEASVVADKLNTASEAAAGRAGKGAGARDEAEE